MERKKHERNKRYGVLIIITLLNWLLIAAIVYFIDPDVIKDFIFPNSYLPMVIFLISGFFWIYSIIFMSAKRAVSWTIGTAIFIYLKIWGMGSLINAILIFGLLGSLEIYSWKTHSNKKVVAQTEE